MQMSEVNSDSIISPAKVHESAPSVIDRLNISIEQQISPYQWPFCTCIAQGRSLVKRNREAVDRITLLPKK